MSLGLNGTKHAGGTSSRISADDGGTSLFPHQFASASILFARMAHVAEMLAHSPPLPLIANYLNANRHASVEDEEAIPLAPQYRARVRLIGLIMSAAKLLKPIVAVDGQFPVPERLYIWPPCDDNMSIMHPTRFQAPQLLYACIQSIT